MLGVLPQAGSDVCAGSAPSQICISQVTPAQGDVSGGNRVVIKGSGFPAKSASTDYVQDGLVLHYDGINNTGGGDLSHSTTAETWKNLAAGKGADAYDQSMPDGIICRNISYACLRGPSDNGRIKWDDKGVKLTNNTGGNDIGWVNIPHDINYENYTVEFVFMTNTLPTTRVDFLGTHTAYNGLFFSNNNCSNGPRVKIEQLTSPTGTNSSTANIASNCTDLAENTPNTMSASFQTTHTGDTKTNFVMRNTNTTPNGSNTQTTNAEVNGFYTTVSGGPHIKYTTPSSSILNEDIYCKANGTPWAPGDIDKEGNDNAKQRCYAALGADPNQGFINTSINLINGSIYSFRIYNRPLSEQETLVNAGVDSARFLTTPEIKIGGTACTDSLILSSTELSCVVAPHAAGKYPLELKYNNQTLTLPNAYEYLQSQISSISPSVGPVKGGSKVVISGQNFPYAPVENYVQDDSLLAQYDALNNLGIGDKSHSTSTTTWKNLHPLANGNLKDTFPDVTLCSNKNYTCTPGENAGSFEWADNSIKYTNNVNGWLKLDHQFDYSNYTVDIVYKVSAIPSKRVDWVGDNVASDGMIVSSFHCSNVGVSLAQYYTDGSTGNANCTPYDVGKISTMTAVATSNSEKGTRVAAYTDAAGVEKVVSTSQLTSRSGGVTTGGVNRCGANGQGNYQCYMAIGQDPNDNGVGIQEIPYGDVYAVRIYKRPLSIPEIIQNVDTDKKRFTDLPVVTIGGQPCTDVTLLSTTQLSCLTPSSGSTGLKDVQVKIGTSTKTLTGGYKYVADNAFYVSSATTGELPTAVAPMFGGNMLKLKGNFTSTPTVRVGGNLCSITNSSTAEIQCTVPPGSVGNADIRVTPASGDEVLMLSALEYLDASNDPVKYRVQRSAGLVSGQYEYTLAGADGDGSVGLEVEPGWTGISAVTLTYPSGLTLAGVPSSGWQQTGSTGSITLTVSPAGTFQTSDAVAAMLKALKWTAPAGVNVGGAVKVDLTNGLW
jgi:hypothetical protein